MSAQYNLGYMYENGKGTKRNYREAAKWYRAAAAQDMADAQSNLGALYQHGKGVPRDYRKATELYRAAAAQGLPLGQLNLAFMTANGAGTEKDLVETYKWLILFLTGEYRPHLQDALKLANKVAAGLTPEQIAEAKRRAEEWRPRERNP